MKKIIIAMCLVAGWSQTAFGYDSYIARINEDGKYCARVEVQSVGLSSQMRTKCRTLSQWEAAGYEITEDVEAFKKEKGIPLSQHHVDLCVDEGFRVCKEPDFIV